MTILASGSHISTRQQEDEEDDNTTAASAGLVLSKLPREIIYEILQKIPSETLSICRAINKPWYRTINNSDFIKTYNTRVIRNSNFPFVISQHDEDDFHDRGDEEETSLTFYTQTPPILQIQSCNGFLLLISKPNDPYFICNPLTGKHTVVQVPKPPGRVSHLAVTGFGWDPASQVFKIIHISDDCTHKLYFGTHLQVYDLGTGHWTVKSWTVRGGDHTPCRVSSIRRFAHRPNTFVKGSLHWIAYPYNGSITIVSFKLETEEFGQVSMPPGLDLDPAESRPHFRFRGIGIPRDTRTFAHHLLVLGGCLCLVHNISNEHIEIWVMEEYGSGSSWRKEHIIRNISAMNNAGPIKGPYRPMQLMQTGEILLLCSDQNLGCYHPVTKHFRYLDASESLYRPLFSRPSLHVGSLVYVAKKNYSSK